jgi:hypothetical protein
MALQILFGDDEHTADEGAYNRLLKTRKWLYLSAGGVTLIGLGLYKPAAAAAALKVIELPAWLLQQALYVGLAYLTAQFGFLLWQLVVTYDIVLRERLAYRRAEELSQAAERLSTAEEEKAAYEDSKLSPDRRARLQSLQDELNRAEAEIDTLYRPREEGGAVAFGTVDWDKARQVVMERLNLAQAGLNDFRIETARNDPLAAARARQVDEARFALIKLRRQDPASRPGYGLFEAVIDIFRVVPPLVFAILTLVRFPPPVP